MSFLDLTNEKEQTFEPVKPGSYLMQVDDAEVKETKSGTGEYVSVKFLIREGEYEGRTIYHMFNIKNDNPKAVEIGLGQLKTFMKCSGQSNFVLKSVTDLIGLSAVGVVKNRTDEYGEKAVISYFKPAEESKTLNATKSSSPF